MKFERKPGSAVASTACTANCQQSEAAEHGVLPCLAWLLQGGAALPGSFRHLAPRHSTCCCPCGATTLCAMTVVLATMQGVAAAVPSGKPPSPQPLGSPLPGQAGRWPAAAHAPLRSAAGPPPLSRRWWQPPRRSQSRCRRRCHPAAQSGAGRRTWGVRWAVGFGVGFGGWGWWRGRQPRVQATASNKVPLQ